MKIVQHLLVVVIVTGLAALARPAASQDARIENVLERSAVYVGESVIYGVFAVNCGNAGKPDPGDLPDFEVSYLGASQESRSHSNFSGQITTTTILKHHYRLRPRKAGVFILPAPTLTVEGKTLKGKPLTLTVKNPEAQNLVRLELEASKTRVYRREPFHRHPGHLRQGPAPRPTRRPIRFAWAKSGPT